MLHQLLEKHTVIIYDGVCGFCNEYIQFILKQKPSRKLKFVSLQSDIGQQIIKLLKIKDSLSSIITIENKRCYKKSNAIFTLMKYLDTPWKYTYYLHIIPSFINNFFYDIIAKHRLKLKKQKCKLLSNYERSFFL